MDNWPEAFLRDTLYRMCVGAARLWLIGRHLRTGELPAAVTIWAYPNARSNSFDWGDNQDGPRGPMAGKRVRIQMTVEDA